MAAQIIMNSFKALHGVVPVREVRLEGNSFRVADEGGGRVARNWECSEAAVVEPARDDSVRSSRPRNGDRTRRVEDHPEQL